MFFNEQWKDSQRLSIIINEQRKDFVQDLNNWTLHNYYGEQGIISCISIKS